MPCGLELAPALPARCSGCTLGADGYAKCVCAQEEAIAMLRLAPMAAVLAMAIAPALADGGGKTFGGYPCADECQGHAAGYRWAERRDITRRRDCPRDRSNAFYEGCRAYVADPDRGADDDDEGEPIPRSRR